jgi:hypothetical protein
MNCEIKKQGIPLLKYIAKHFRLLNDHMNYLDFVMVQWRIKLIVFPGNLSVEGELTVKLRMMDPGFKPPALGLQVWFFLMN